MEPNPTRRQGLVFLSGAALGVLLGVGGFFLNTTSILSLPTETVSEAALETPESSGLLSVRNQAAGHMALVDSVRVYPPGGWVVIHEVTTSNDLGNALGAVRVRGDTAPVAIELLRETLPNHSYAAVLYRDDGDDNFSLVGDSIYVDFDTGTRIVSPFKTLP